MSQDHWMTSQEEEEFEIEHKGEKGVFAIKKPTWADKMQAISKATTYTQAGEVRFDMDEYYINLLLKVLKRAPFSVTATALRALDPIVGLQLMKRVPSPTEGGWGELKNE